MASSQFTPVTFSTPAASGTIYPHGAHVTAWTPAGEKPVLWLSRESLFVPEKAIRGGVPICFPWFGKGRSGKMSPAHGVARILPWREIARRDDGATFELTDADLQDPAARAQFPHKFTAHYAVTFGETLELRLTVRNTDTAAFSYEEALHTYIAVSDVREIAVTGFNGVTYFDRAGGRNETHTQAGDIRFTAETDRIYLTAATARIVDPGWNRTIVVERENSATSVVWNPGAELAAGMADFGDDEWPGMVCVEGANALADAIELAPGAEHTLGYRLRVE